jgi:adenosylmethionine-8-amino-7-oxononanoate aminotransferase
MHPLARLDHRYLWHPFTQMKDWLKNEPILITSGRGSVLQDVHGHSYLDANASIWTNLHGHNHPRINAAITRQLNKIAHSSALGFANEPASLLGEALVKLANPNSHRHSPRSPRLEKVFFSDDGSTALEVALKLAYEFSRRRGQSKRPRFLSLQGAYHGDTVGAVSLGHIDLFHKAYQGLLFKSDPVMAPYCYRCPFNKARPERADARSYRKCQWECVDSVEKAFAHRKKKGGNYAGFVFEPLMQGAAGMIPQPAGWLRRVTAIARHHDTPLIADEVMTAFGRTGSSPAIPSTPACPPSPLFACHQEGVQPDFLAVAKGLTGGYLPMAATLTSPSVFDVFLGEYDSFKSFFHGHSFTGNQLGAAAALTSLDLLQSRACQNRRRSLEKTMTKELNALWNLPAIGDIRQVGLVAGVELVRDWKKRTPFPLSKKAGIRVCEAMAQRGVLTRPIGNVIALVPPYSTTQAQLRTIIRSLYDAVNAVLPPA